MTLSIAAVADMWTSPRMRLTITSSPSGPMPVLPGSPVVVHRIHADGQRYPVILDADARLGSASWSGFDYHAPFNQEVTYVALVSGQESAPSGVQYLLSEDSWLIHPTDPALSMIPRKIVKIGDRGAESNSATFDVWGSAFPVSLSSGVRKAITGDLTVSCEAADEHVLVELLERSGPILINTPGWVGWDLRWAWIQPGRVTYSNVVGIVDFPIRQVSFPYQVVAQPDTNTTPEWSWAKVAATYATFGAVRDAYANGTALKLDARS